MTITHLKGSTIPDGADTKIVRPSDWNAEHVMRSRVSTTAINYTALATDEVIVVTANNVNITLPTAVGCTGQIYQINNSGTGTVTMLTTSSQTINGDASGVVKLARWEQLTVMSTNTNWIVIY
jgi:hypothetical protein